MLHRIVPGYIVQGGDFTSRDGNGQMSIYGGLFEDENFLVPHDSPGDDLYSKTVDTSQWEQKNSEILFWKCKFF